MLLFFSISDSLPVATDINLILLFISAVLLSLLVLMLKNVNLLIIRSLLKKMKNIQLDIIYVSY